MHYAFEKIVLCISNYNFKVDVYLTNRHKKKHFSKPCRSRIFKLKIVHSRVKGVK